MYRLLLVSVVLWSSSAAAQVAESSPWSYLFDGQLIEIQLDGSQFAMFCESDNVEYEALREACASIPELKGLERSDEQKYPGLWIVQATHCVSEARALAISAKLSTSDGVSGAPCFDAKGTPVLPRRAIMLALETRVENPNLWLQARGYAVERRFPGLKPTFLVSYSGKRTDVFARSRQLSELPEVCWAEPDFLLRRNALGIPNDPRFDDQWNLENVGQTQGLIGADIGALEAWDITTGSDTIVIAILDDGVLQTHEDLMANIVPGYDATDQPSPGGVPGAPLDDDRHGTWMAGIAGAVGNNGVGVAGVAWNCKIMSVRIFYDDFEQPSWAVDGITWAADNGADILSNSWGDPIPFASHQTALQYATTLGRGGLGCPAFAGGGNSGDPVLLYPAEFPESIAVGGTSSCDTRKTSSTCDEFQGSVNYGDQLDIVAPTISIPTTDGVAVPFPTSGYRLVGGSSASAAMAAGAGALLLSVNPALTEPEVRALLESSADDQVGTWNEDLPGRDPHMGWGRLNIWRMLQLQAGTPSPVRSVTCQNVDESVTITWENPVLFDSLTVTRDGTTIATLPGMDEQFTDAPGRGGPYRYEIQGTVGAQQSLEAHCSTIVFGDATELVWAPLDAAGSVDGGAALETSLDANGRSTVMIHEVHPSIDMSVVDRLWVNLGQPPANHVLSHADGETLLRYLLDGVGGQQLYIEGGAIWSEDPITIFQGSFHFFGGDIGGELGLVEGFTFAPCGFSGLDLVYEGEPGPVSRVGFPTVPFLDSSLLQENASPSFFVATRHVGSTYEIIRAGHEFGGYTDGATTKDDLMAQYLFCFGVSTDSEFMRGDVNGDGSLDIGDPLTALSALFEQAVTSCEDANDANDDGQFDIADPLSLLGYLFSSGSPPDPPGLSCGSDPTTDILGCETYSNCP